MARACAIPGINLRDYSRTAAQRGWGSGWPSCDGVKQFKLVTVIADQSGTKVTVNARIGRLVDLLMDTTEKRGYRLQPKATGGNNCRPIGGTNKPSNHSWGLAVDVNWNDNPYTTTGKHDIPEWVYALWARYGFANGGDYSGAKKDWMHFEFMGTPEQADRAIELAIRELAGDQGLTPAAHPTIRRGETNKTIVAYAQRLLGIEDDGIFGTGTESTVRFFQEQRGLTVDGVIGQSTWAALLAPKPKRSDDVSNGMLPADRDGEFFFSVHAGKNSGLVEACWVTLHSKKPMTVRWRWVTEKGPNGEYGVIQTKDYGFAWASSADSGLPGVLGIEGTYTASSPVGWEIEKKPR